MASYASENRDLILGGFQQAPGLAQKVREDNIQNGPTSDYQKQLAAGVQAKRGGPPDMKTAIQRIMNGESAAAVAAEMKGGNTGGLTGAPAAGGPGLAAQSAEKAFAPVMPQSGLSQGPQDQRDWRSMLEAGRAGREQRDYQAEIELRAKHAAELERLRAEGRTAIVDKTEEGKNTRAEAGRGSREGIASEKLEEGKRQFDSTLAYKDRHLDYLRDRAADWARLTSRKFTETDPDIKLYSEVTKNARGKLNTVADMMKSTGLSDEQKASVMEEYKVLQQKAEELLPRIEAKVKAKQAEKEQSSTTVETRSSGAAYQVGQKYQTPRGLRTFRGKDAAGKNVWAAD